MDDMVHVNSYDVILYDEFYLTKFRLTTVYICSALVTKVSHHHAEVENSRVLPKRDIAS